MMRKFLSLPLCASLVCACTVGPDFTRPDTAPPQSYAAAGDAPMPRDQHLQLGHAAADWWKAFGSPALDATVALALSDNNDIAAARARVEEVEEQVAAAKGALLPQASLGATVGRQKYGVTMFGPLDIKVPPYTYYSVGPSLSVPLDIFGGGRRALEENEARAEYQGYELDAARLSLIANVVAQSIALASAQAQAAIMQDVIQSDRRNVELARIAVDGGTAPRTQFLDSERQLAAAEDIQPQIEKQASMARHSLAILVGKAPADWTPPAISLDDLALPQDIPASVPSELIRRRPDIAAAEAQLHAASAAIGVATADLYPKIDLAGSFALQALTPGDLFNSSGAAWSAAASLTQPLFEGGQLRAKRNAAIDAYDASLAEYKQTILASFADVADRLQDLSQDADQFRAESDSAQSASEARDLARQGFAQGYANVFEVLAAERNASDAAIALDRARAQRLVDTAALFMALGGSGLDAGPLVAPAKKDARNEEAFAGGRAPDAP